MRCRGVYLAKIMVCLPFCLLTACTHMGKWTSSVSGHPYEVLVVGDRKGMVTAALSQAVPGLPQREPMFDVSRIDSVRFSGGLRMARNIVIVSINPQLGSHTKVFVVRENVLPGQFLVNIEAPSVYALQRDETMWSPKLIALLNAAECRREIEEMKHRRNHEMERRIKQEMGVELYIPADMTSCKSGKNLMWISNNSVTGMQNIVIYKMPVAQSAERRIFLRDSIMKANVHGETDSMYIVTVPQSVRESRVERVQESVVILRGLWQMKGDQMGGPFVSHSVAGITVESFVYAPGKKKRNLLRQGEAVLYTLKRTNNGQ